MTAITSINRRFLIAGAGILAVAAGVYGLASFSPALGPIAGSIAPQLYVDSVAGAQIPLHGPYVLVDAASARLYMIDDGRVQDSMRVIVGKPDTPTPELKDVINYETLNPYWHVPADLTRSLIAANVLKQGPAYLSAHGYEVVSAFAKEAQVIPPDRVDWKAVAAGTQQIFVREQPGPANSLGRFKFDLPNGDGIYLHDTPKKDLFAQADRDLSHGCVRLEDAERLAKWLLGKDPPAAAAPEENLLLPHPVPITISYLDPHSQMQLAALR
ncbi:MAG TPA: L,D-transpeptidase family protein [Sphingomicrobium sp.]|jgi:murein L,D-transpeptidase YcbB/YkuD|nr:L,D-transpeptidase family protein [Sphingomicrobium sp.]